MEELIQKLIDYLKSLNPRPKKPDPVVKPPPPKPTLVPPVTHGFPGDADFKAQVVSQINARRRAYSALMTVLAANLSGPVGNFAQAWADHKAQEDSGVPDHGDYKARVRAASLGGRYMGEIGTTGNDNPTGLVERWMASPEHRAKILDPEFEVCGVGRATSENGTIYTFVDFSS